MVSLSCSYMGNEGYVPAAYLRKIGSGRHSVVTQYDGERKMAVASSSPATLRKESGECCGPCCLGNIVGTFQNATRCQRHCSAWAGDECQSWRRRFTCEALSDVSKMASSQRSEAIAS